jgi:hypothetical protein
MIWLIVLTCLCLLGALPVGICAQYSQGIAQAWIRVGFLRFPLRRGKPKKKEIVKEEAFEHHAQAGKRKKDGGITQYFPLVQLVLDFLTDFRTKLRINDLRFCAILASDDPCDLSIHYGRAWAALGGLMPILERCFVIKSRKLEIACDYTAEKTCIDGYIDLTITVAQILSIGVYHGIKVLSKYYQITKKVKDGATL